jgi:hypothetical protein
MLNTKIDLDQNLPELSIYLYGFIVFSFAKYISIWQYESFNVHEKPGEEVVKVTSTIHPENIIKENEVNF